MKKINKNIGLGTFSLLLAIIGILFNLSVNGYPCFGDYVFEFIGLKSWSGNNGGTHYTIYYTLIFSIPSVILAYKNKNDFGAKTGGVISLLLSTPPITIMILVLFDLVRNYI